MRSVEDRLVAHPAFLRAERHEEDFVRAEHGVLERPGALRRTGASGPRKTSEKGSVRSAGTSARGARDPRGSTVPSVSSSVPSGNRIVKAAPTSGVNSEIESVSVTGPSARREDARGRALRPAPGNGEAAAASPARRA